MKFFRRRKIIVSMPAAWVRFKAAVDDRQHQAADYLQRQTLRYSQFKVYVFFALFCLFASSASVFVVIDALKSKKSSSSLSPISIPQHIIQRSNEQDRHNGKVRSSQYSRVLLLRQQIDSLKVNNRFYYDSIIQARPGLLDSIRLLEKFLQGKR